MSSNKLSPQVLGNLVTLIRGELVKIEPEDIEEGKQERWITNHILAPRLKKILNEYGQHSFIVRHDGGLAPRPLILSGMSFSPDIDISYFQQKCIAIEVKVLRDNDPTGSLTKCMGQTNLYSLLGFHASIGVLIDERGRRSAKLQEFLLNSRDSDRSISFIYI